MSEYLIHEMKSPLTLIREMRFFRNPRKNSLVFVPAGNHTDGEGGAGREESPLRIAGDEKFGCFCETKPRSRFKSTGATSQGSKTVQISTRRNRTTANDQNNLMKEQEIKPHQESHHRHESAHYGSSHLPRQDWSIITAQNRSDTN